MCEVSVQILDAIQEKELASATEKLDCTDTSLLTAIDLIFATIKPRVALK